jgi:predicted carbohydrate-binding protein with CBM5 and CBM33 domain
MKFTTTTPLLFSATGLAALANAHGYFESPKGRQPGTTFQDACGMQAYYNMEGSINGNIQGLEQVVASQSDYKPAECHLWMCKGMKYLDNTE